MPRRGLANFVGRASIIVASLIGSAALASEPATKDLIARLGGSDWTQRQSAEDAIVGLGPAAIDDLTAAITATDDVELRERLNSAIARIGREQLTSATPVTVDKVFDRPIDALRAIANVAGLSLALEGEQAAALLERAKPIHLQCDQTPFLKALFDCAGDAQLSVRLSGEQIIVGDRPAIEGRPRMVTSGALALVADSVRHSESIDFSSDRHSSTTYLSLSLFTEPKLRLANGTVVLSIRGISDEQGRSMIAKPFKLPINHAPDGRWTCQIALATASPAEKIAKLDVELQANVVTETNDLRIDDLSTLPADMPTDEGPVGVRSVSSSGGAWTIVLHVPQARSAFGQNARMWQFGDPDLLKILDGHRRRLGTGLATLAMGQDLELTLPIKLIDPADGPKSVLLRMPSRMKEYRARLVLSDLPLPQP